MSVAGRTGPWRVSAAAAMSLLLVGAVGCSSATPSNPVATTPATPATSASSASGPYTGYPDSMAALGHSLITGEGTQPGGNESAWKGNSWATGTNPEVNSVYARLRQVNPAIEGQVHNLGTGGANLAALTEQAQMLTQLQPQPELVIIATLDGDITCPASAADFTTYGTGLKSLLKSLSKQMPASRFFITAQTSTPSHDIEIYSPEERASVGDTGPCSALDPKGKLVPVELKRLEAAIAGYKAQVTAACAEVDRCHTDQSGKGWSLRRSDLSDDLNHMNISGQARWAEHEWALLEAAHLVPAG
jgi:hypothetical protein